MAFGIDDAIAAGLTVLNKFIPDPAAKLAAEQELRVALLSWDNAQSAINAAEAGNQSIFVAGWRPWIGWCCGAALFYSYLLVPLVMWGSFLVGHPLPKPPVLNDHLWELMTGMLGLGGLRTYEKIKGIA